MSGPAAFVPEECSGYDLAVLLGISPRAIRDWAARGVMVRAEKEGRYLTLDSIHNYLERLRDGHDMRALPVAEVLEDDRPNKKAGGVNNKRRSRK